MNLTAVLILVGVAWLVVATWRRHRERAAEREAIDREYRESVLRRAQVKPRNDEEEDYLLKLRAGVKARPGEPSSESPPRPTGSPNKFLD